VAPAAVERPAPAPTAAPAAAPAAPAARDAPSSPAARPSPAPSTAPASGPARTPAQAPAPSGTGDSPARVPQPGLGRDDIFSPRQDAAPAPLPPARPRIDLDAARQRAREVANEGVGSRGLLPLQITAPLDPKKSKLERELEKSIRPDCSEAYQGMGLLAAPALIAGALSNDSGCRWRK
jgi:hypothetical protein